MSPDASRRPSGLNARLGTVLVWAVRRCAEGLAGVDIPEPHGEILAGAGEPVAVGAERGLLDGVGVAGEGRADRLAGVGIPEPRGFIVARAGQALTVRAERHTLHGFAMAGEGYPDLLAGVCVPELYGLCPYWRRRDGGPSGLKMTLIEGIGVAQ